MNDALTNILAECLERMEAGASLESCLSAFPEQAAELESLLRMTQQMQSLTKIEPRPTFSQNARLHLENKLARSEKAVTFERLKRHIGQKPKLIIQRRFSMLQLIIAAMLLFTAATGGVAYAANASNPGDALHGLDLAMEQAQLNLTPGASNQLALRLAFANERLQEAQATFAKNDTTDGQEALNEYGTEISGIAQQIGSADGADQQKLESLYESAQAIHKDVLTKLLATVPPQAQSAIQKALDASNAPATLPIGGPQNGATGRPTDVPAGAPAGVPNGRPTELPNGATLGCPTPVAPVSGQPANIPSGTSNANGCPPITLPHIIPTHVAPPVGAPSGKP